MKKLLLLCAISAIFTANAQEIQPAGPKLTVPVITAPAFNQDRSTACGVDTMLYTQAKSTGAQGISINNSTSAYAFCQYFDCPQEITVHGAQFVAYKPNSTNGDTIQVTVAIYLASPDSIPWGPPLATTTTPVDINNWLFNLDDMRKTAIFDNPVIMNEPYVISVINNSATSITMYSSDYTTGDGLGENLGSARIGFNWVRGYDVNVGGNPFDADMLFYPIVSYDLDADLYLDPNCDLLAGDVDATNLSSPVLFNRFYSQEAFAGTAGSQSTWDWGDASPTETGINPTHTYGAGVFDVTLTDTLVGWYTNCIDEETLSTCAPPIADFEVIDTTCLVDCAIITNNSLRADTYAWTFQGGNPAAYTAMSPDSVCWSAPGTYDIQLIVTNDAGSDTMSTTITIDACGVGMEEENYSDLLLYPNPANSFVTLKSTEAIKGIEMYDLSGKLISTEEMTTSSLTQINIEHLPTGMYVIKVQFNNGAVENKRFQVIR